MNLDQWISIWIWIIGSLSGSGSVDGFWVKLAFLFTCMFVDEAQVHRLGDLSLNGSDYKMARSESRNVEYD